MLKFWIAVHIAYIIQQIFLFVHLSRLICEAHVVLSLIVLQNHVEAYHELSSKTQIYFSTAAAKWDADFYIKVDDDVHVNLG